VVACEAQIHLETSLLDIKGQVFLGGEISLHRHGRWKQDISREPGVVWILRQWQKATIRNTQKAYLKPFCKTFSRFVFTWKVVVRLVWWCTPVIPATSIPVNRRIMVQTRLGISTKPHLKNNQSRKCWGHGLCGRAPA
jgi:hypothetical protein